MAHVPSRGLCMCCCRLYPQKTIQCQTLFCSRTIRCCGIKMHNFIDWNTDILTVHLPSCILAIVKEVLHFPPNQLMILQFAEKKVTTEIQPPI